MTYTANRSYTCSVAWPDALARGDDAVMVMTCDRFFFFFAHLSVTPVNFTDSMRPKPPERYSSRGQRVEDSFYSGAVYTYRFPSGFVSVKKNHK